MRLDPVLTYVPGGDADALSQRLGGASVIKLASNENPLGAPHGARAALAAAVERTHLYPEPDSATLRAALAARLGLADDEILICPGTTHAIQLAALATAIAHPGAAAIAPTGAFLAYRVAASQTNLRVIDVPLVDDRHDLDALLAAAQAPDVGVLFLANPNNPTGTRLDPEPLARFLAAVPARVLIVLDEAYIEYLDPRRRVDAAALVRRHPNLIVLRTFSKIYGLAALRVGYVLGQTPTLARLGRFVMPFCVSAAAQRAALAALADDVFIARSFAHNHRERARLTRGLCALGLRPTASDANFVCVDLARPAAPIAAELADRGILVRTLEPYAMPTALRITVGLAAENTACLAALRALLDPRAAGDAPIEEAC